MFDCRLHFRFKLSHSEQCFPMAKNTVGDFTLPLHIYNEIANLCGSYERMSKEQIVQVAEDVMELLVKNDGAEENVQVKSKNMGAHPKNRDEEKLIADRAHSRVHKVKSIGFSSKRANLDAVAFQDHPIDKTIAKSMVELVSMSPYFAQYKMSDVMYGSVGSTHFNHGLECANQRVPCAIPEISEDGYMSAAKLANGSPKFAKALADGLIWTIIRWEVEVMFPGLPSLLQSALNASGQIQDGDFTP